MIKCNYCELYFKNRHGLHIHWFYCLAKGFKESKIKYVNGEKYFELMEDSRLMPIAHFPKPFVKYFKEGEFGMKYNVRYVLK